MQSPTSRNLFVSFFTNFFFFVSLERDKANRSIKYLISSPFQSKSKQTNNESLKRIAGTLFTLAGALKMTTVAHRFLSIKRRILFTEKKLPKTKTAVSRYRSEE